ncbi:MAG TPA: sigma-70 family RNA polymerase sigma factor [Chitinophagales bacterium]|nr:sigma-70 family RNA polymerase sigma factor [Chitinophagales bacterium]
MEVNPNFSPRANEDIELVQQALAGDQKAYARLMTRYKDSIYFLLLKMVHNEDDANDLTIEAFGKAFSNLAKYTPDFAFSTWLYKIALNNCIDFIRKKKVETLSLFEVNENDQGETFRIDVQSSAPDPEESYIRKQRNKLLREVIEKINPKYRLLIELRYYDELSYEEIAEETNLPLGTVKAQLFRAKGLLYQILSSGREHM